MGRSQARQTHTLQITGPDVEERLVTRGAGSRTEGEACGLLSPEASRDSASRKTKPGDRVWSGLGAARAILMEAVWLSR